jgi:hypothetical protein
VLVMILLRHAFMSFAGMVVPALYAR